MFAAIGYTDEQFFNLQTDVIASVLKNHQNVLLDFVLKLGMRKTATARLNVSIEEMDIDFVDDSFTLSNTNHQTLQAHVANPPPAIPDKENLPNPNNTLNPNNTSSLIHDVPSQALVPTEEVTFLENDLFKYLNSTLKGKVVLGKYKNSKDLDVGLLKDLLIWDTIGEDALYYKISKGTFRKFMTEIGQLFPTIAKDIDLRFEDKSTSTYGKECAYTRGSFYHFYKAVRKEFREAGILDKSSCKKSCTSQCDIQGIFISSTDERLASLTDQDRSSHSVNEVSSVWEETYTERVKLLLQKEKRVKVVSLASYFSSFPCLRHPVGIVLLAQDFKEFLKDLKKNNVLGTNTVSEVESLFIKRWPGIAEKIIKAAKNNAESKKSKVTEVVDFVRDHKKLITAGKHDSVLALLVLPLLIKTTKIYKISKELSLTLKKQQIADSFILHVKDAANLQTEQKEFENWITSLKLQIYPYLIFCGNLDSVQCYLVINNEKYFFEDPIQAVESCYKCLTALYAFPSICDFVWAFIDKAVYNLEIRKTITAVSNFYNKIDEDRR